MEETKYIIPAGSKGGGKGGGGGGHTPVEDPNSLQSSAKVRVLYLVGEGEIEGLVDGDKSVFFDGVPLQNEDDSYNFTDCIVEERVGTSSQVHIKGISDVAADTTVLNSEVTYSTPVIHNVSDTDVDDVTVILQVNALYNVNAEGDIKETSVAYKIEVQPDGGGYQVAVASQTISGKCTNPYQKKVRLTDLDNSYGSGPWNIKITRLTADSTTAKLVNKTYVYGVSEIKNRKIQYRNSAVYGIEITAEQFNGRVPQVTFDLKGGLIKVPSNLTWNQALDTVSYSGVWDGTFKTEYSNNPAWWLYNIIETDRYGLGKASTYIDKWTLYNLGVYCDEQVDDGYGDTERRFTFNTVIANRSDARHLLTMMASVMRAYVFWAGGQATFTQDRDKDPARLVSAANVKDGMFNYSGNSISERYTVAYVTWNDPDDDYKQAVEVVTDDDGIRRYGYKSFDVVAFGCTSRGQAFRYGKWILLSQLYETERIEYTAGFDHIDCKIGDVHDVADPHMSATNRFGGRIVSATSTSITIDSPVDLENGTTYSLEFFTASGTYTQRDLTNSTPSSDVTVLTWASAADLPVTNSMWLLIASDLSPRPFRVIGVEEVDKHEYKVNGSYYWEGKFAEIESGYYLNDPPYTNIPTGALNAPSSLTATAFTYTDGGKNNTYYGVALGWNKANDPRTQYYELQYRGDGETWDAVGNTSTTAYQIKPIEPGIWDFRVRSRDVAGHSVWVTLLDYAVTTISGVAAPTNVRVKGGGTTWSGTDCEVEWTASIGAVYQDYAIDNKIVAGYQVQVYRDSDSQLLRTEALGNITNYTYTMAKNQSDNKELDGSGPQRALEFHIYTISVYDDLSATYGGATLTNPAPNMGGFVPTITNLFQGVKIDWSNITPADNDGDHFVVFVGLTSPPASGTQVATVGWDTRHWVELGLDTDLVYYAKVVPYDKFGIGVASASSLSIEPLKVAAVDIDAELSSSIAMSDSLGTTASGLIELYDRTIDSGGIAYNNGDWVNYDMGIETFADGVRVYSSAGVNMYVSYKTNSGSWKYLSGEADHTLDANGYMIDRATASGTAETNYLTMSSGKSVAKFPQRIIGRDFRLHILSSTTLYELIFEREVIAELVVAEYLSAISANLGTILTGILQSPTYPASGLYIDMTTGEIHGVITADDIVTGTLSTGLVTVTSTDGKMYMTGNTFTVKDASNVTRVKIGKLS